MNGMITMEHYGIRDWSGTVCDGRQIVEGLMNRPDLLKALQMTGILPHAGPGADALGVEDVSATMASAEYLEEELIFWKRLRKVPAKSLTVEATRLNAYRSGFQTGFISANDAGFVGDPNFTRLFATIRYMAEKYETDLPTQLVEAIGPDGRGVNVQATNRMAAMGRLLQNIERNTVFGDTRLDNVQWKGVLQWIDEAATTQNRIRLDLQGGFLNRYVLAYMSQIASDNHANPTEFFVPNEGYLDLQLSFFPEMRSTQGVTQAAFGNDFDRLVVLSLGGNPARMGITRMAMLTYGISGGMPRRPFGVAAQNPPTAPTSVAVAAENFTATTGHQGVKGGTYVYRVAALGKGGNTLTVASATVSPTAGQRVRVTITDPDENVLSYMVFRNKPGEDGTVSDNCYFLGQVGRPAGGVAVDFLDDGFALPDCYHALQVTMNPQRFYMRQLLPVLERKLPPALMTNQAGLLYFGTPFLEEPMKNIHLCNIGKQPQLAIAGLGDYPN